MKTFSRQSFCVVRYIKLCQLFQLELVWTSASPMFSSSVAMKKKSPYFKFLRRAIMDLTENGWLDIYLKRQSQQLTDNCISEESVGNPLGYLKLATLFYILGLGIILSGFIFIYEYFLNPQQNLKINQINEKEEVGNLMQSLLKSIPLLHGKLKTNAEELVELLDEQLCN